MPRRARAFTLIEVLIALVIFAILGFAVTSRVGDIVNQTYLIERRTVAHWVADNHLTRMRIAQSVTNEVLPTGRERERVVLAGRRWLLEIAVEDTTHPWLRRVQIEVFELVDDEEIGPLELATAFVGRY